MLSKYDLDAVKRPNLDHGSKVRLTGFEFLSGSSGEFDNTEPMICKIRWRSNINVDDLRIRFSVDNMDTTPVGLAESDIIGDAREGEENECTLKWDMSNIVGGDYLISLDLYVINEYGSRYSYDHPSLKIRIHLEDKVGGSEKSYMWDRRSWNSVRLNTICRNI